ncbi:hypothetical protein HED39_02605 [Enterococcus casseliflavus]|uniref:alpha-L-rhamnosidase-related protein n=1 Tax=Enterococcus casseliflavus TaxID=37734 RepID=UPI001432E3C7|nr:alpha-L-rhamnosidase C-terminal domain-containing protein [Enterococcus casseliflavus]NKD28197.1 hypothetical protein [Enterococcus casseliflavus]
MSVKKEPKWIWLKQWTPENKEEPQQIFFRKTIKLDRQCLGTVKISADTRYKLYLNGQLVEIGPSKGDNQVWFLDEIDVSAYLKQGINVFSVKILRYPMNHEKGNHAMFRTEYPGLYLDATFTEVNGEKKQVVSDESWRTYLDPRFKIISESDIFAPLKIYEDVIGHSVTNTWMNESFDDQDWDFAQPYKQYTVSRQVSPGNLIPRTIPYMYRKSRRFEKVMTTRTATPEIRTWEDWIHTANPVTIPANTTAIVEISAGEEMTGYLHLSMQGGKGSDVKLLQSESYVQDEMTSTNDMPIPVKTDREDYIAGHLDGFTDRYKVAGCGTDKAPELYEPFWLRTFRFIQLKVVTKAEPLTLVDFTFTETGYPLNVQTKVTTSDESLAAVWDISERTLRRCMHETYEDCPFYEQLQYAMDSRTQILYTYAISADDRLARKCMDDFRRSQRYDGLLNCSYPCFGSNVIPCFSIYYILMLHDHMMYFGDIDIIEDHMPTVQRILNFFNQHIAPQGYVEKIGGLNIVDRFWSFTDWTKEWNASTGVPHATLTGPITMESLVYVMGLQKAADLATFLGQKELSRLYIDRAESVQVALRENCIGANGMFQDGPGIESYSQHQQVFALLTQTVDKEQGKKNLLETILNKESYAQCSVAMAFYLYRAMEEADLYAYTNDYWDIWRRMVAKHATTCVEAEAGDRSDCHAWGAVILYELPSITLGVRPTSPGFSTITIAPNAGYFNWAKGSVITPKGMVEVSWEKKAGEIYLTYKAPESIKVIVPEGVHVFES